MTNGKFINEIMELDKKFGVEKKSHNSRVEQWKGIHHRHNGIYYIMSMVYTNNIQCDQVFIDFILFSMGSSRIATLLTCICSLSAGSYVSL